MVLATRFESARGWETIVKIPGHRLTNCDSAESAVEILKHELAGAGVDHDLQGTWLLSIPPTTTNGFSIDVLQTTKHQPLKCFFGLLEHECQSLDECFFWISRALSNSYQLKTIYVSGVPRQWSLEPKDPNSDNPRLEMGHGVISFWWRSKIAETRFNPMTLFRKVPGDGLIE